MNTSSNLLANRVSEIEESITLKITGLAKTLRSEGKNILAFSAGEPDFDTPSHIKESGIRAIQEGKNKYTVASGIPELKEAVCQKLLRDQNLTYSSDQIVISCGAKHSIFNVLMATINPGDEVIVPSPYWVSYPEQIKLFGGQPIILQTTEETGLKITPDQLEKSITPKTKLLILNSPSNPTGMIYSKSEIEALADVVLAHNIWVLSDEIYEHLIYGNNTHFSIAQVSPEMKERTILVNGWSKAYAMTGWRLGFIACNPDLAKAVGKIQSQSTSNPTTCAQWAGITALNGSQKAVNDMKAAFDERRQYTIQTLNTISGITCLEPFGAFYAFPNISQYFGKSAQGGTITDSVTFCQFLLEESLVAVVPGSGFGAEGFIRFSYATSKEAIVEGLNRLRSFVEGLH
ncbi:MAG: pyridoxal phosphate-dependent aminotransferase [Candidatus Margulisbacteria bacterium]|nr:pyridoxal phosphate-dependent aminotransferase [Candidatus Margulisiibacteriota bacterium]